MKLTKDALRSLARRSDGASSLSWCFSTLVAAREGRRAALAAFAVAAALWACGRRTPPPEGRQVASPSPQLSGHRPFITGYGARFDLPEGCSGKCCNEIDYVRGEIRCAGSEISFGSGFDHMVSHYLKRDSSGVEGTESIEGGRRFWGKTCTKDGEVFCAVLEFERGADMGLQYHEFCAPSAAQGARDRVLATARSYRRIAAKEEFVCPYCE